VNHYDPGADGWRALPRAALPSGLGVPWARKVDDQWRYGLSTVAEHGNPNGVVHGGVLMAFADHGLSLLAWEAAERAVCTTIQLNTHFLDAARPGDFLELRGEVTRRGLGLMFLRGIIASRQSAGNKDVVAMDGIWRVLRSR
jgi:uncharacterized protein (TIGR00369 family)